MNTVRADHERRARIGTKNGLRQLTDEELVRILDAPPRPQELIVRVVSGTTTHVTVDPVEWHAAGAGPLTIELAKVTDLGPAEQLRTLCPIRWRDEYAGCLRVLVDWTTWSRHLHPEAWAQK